MKNCILAITAALFFIAPTFELPRVDAETKTLEAPKVIVVKYDADW